MNERLAELADRYKDRPLVRGLVQLIPAGIGSAVETALLTKLANYRAGRLRVFFDELAEGKLSLTPDIIESEDFLHAFDATTRAVLRARRTEKVKLLARLLKSSFRDEGPASIDEYEELLAILDDLSFREIKVLAILARHERDTAFRPEDNDLQRANKAWPGFETEVQARLGISPEQLAPVLVRIQRSGCFAEITGGYWGYVGGRGRLTGLFQRLQDVVGDLDDVAA